MATENPSAFPQSLSSEGPFGGMTLRDWFAGQALAGICSNASIYDGCGHTAQLAAQHAHATGEAYRIADAMLAARTGTPS